MSVRFKFDDVMDLTMFENFNADRISPSEAKKNFNRMGMRTRTKR